MHPSTLLLLAIAHVMPAGPEPPSMQGRYGLLVDVGARVELPGVGPTEATYQSLILVDVEPAADGSIKQRHRTCDVVIDEELPLVQMVVPSAAVRSIRPGTSSVRVGDGERGKTWQTDLGRRDIGFVSSSSRMPDHAEDAAVIDQDGDGKPGVTLGLRLPIGQLDVYVVQRDHAVLSGRVIGPDLVEGSVEIKSLENRVLGTSPSLPNAQVTISPIPGKASFAMFRVPESTSCRELLGSWRGQLTQARGGAGQETAAATGAHKRSAP